MKDQGGWCRRNHPSLFHHFVIGNINQREVLAANFWQGLLLFFQLFCGWLQSYAGKIITIAQWMNWNLLILINALFLHREHIRDSCHYKIYSIRFNKQKVSLVCYSQLQRSYVDSSIIVHLWLWVITAACDTVKQRECDAGVNAQHQLSCWLRCRCSRKPDDKRTPNGWNHHWSSDS